jgi:hypothetical protein
MVSSPLGNCPDASQDDLKGDSEMNHHDLITAPLAKFSSQVTPRGRRIKFTPERIQQIRNLCVLFKYRQRKEERRRDNRNVNRRQQRDPARVHSRSPNAARSLRGLASLKDSQSLRGNQICAPGFGRSAER